MRTRPARILASAGTAGAGAGTGLAAYVIVGGLPGMLYAAGICLGAALGAVAILTRRTVSVSELVAAPLQPLRRREAPAISEPAPGFVAARVVYPEAVASGSELEDHRAALANMGAQLARESDAARRDMQRLETRIRELETERDELLALVARERARFERSLEALCDGVGAELAQLEPTLDGLAVG